MNTADRQKESLTPEGGQARLLREKDEQLEAQARRIRELEAQLRQLEARSAALQESFDTISNAFFWKLTAPARLLLDRIKQLLRPRPKRFALRIRRRGGRRAPSIIYNLELPKQNTFRYGVIPVEGWAFSPNGPIREILIRCGEKKLSAEINLLREDVGACYPDCLPFSKYSGFRAEIQLGEEELKKVQTLQIVIAAEDGSRKIPALQLYPGGFSAPASPRGASAALSKAKRFFLSGKRPRTWAELWALTQKFFLLFFGAKANFDRPAGLDGADAYQIWQMKNAFDARKRARCLERLEELAYRPLISVIMPAYDTDPALLEKVIASVQSQLYPNWELIVNDDASPSVNLEEIVARCAQGDARIVFHRMETNSNISLATNAAAALAKGEYLLFVDHDDLLEPNALSAVVEKLNENPALDIVYSDDDKITMDDIRYDPQFKPAYSPELLLSYMYFSHLFVLRKTLFDRVGGCRKGYEGSQDYDLALRAVEQTDQIAHIPEVLYHWRAAPNSTARSTDTKPASVERGRRAVADAAARRGIPARVEIPDFAEKAKIGIYTLRYAGGDYPKISIVIPTRNHTEDLRRCLDSITQKTDYPNYEILLVDNGSDEEETLAYYKTLPWKVVWCGNVDGAFNFSHMVNCGVAAAEGEYIVLLNNDTEVISPSWLQDLLVYLRIPGVGVAGCKLLYQDGTVQHAGVVLKMGNGVAGHAFKLIPDWDGGYLSYANSARNYSAVTAAALMTTRELYERAGGFDAERFGVSYNDVDFCLRVRKLGYRVVFVPNARLYHHEGKSRGVEQSGHYSSPKEEYALVRAWGLDPAYTDPYYSPNLSVEDERFGIERRHVVVHGRPCKRILLFTHNLNFEGAPLVQFWVAQGLRDRYAFLLLSPEDGPLREKYEECGIEVRIFSAEGVFASGKKLTDSLRRTAESVRDFSPELIYANTADMFFGAELGAVMELPVVWAIHESVEYQSYFKRYGDEISRMAIRRFMGVTRAVFVAEATAKLYRDLDTCQFITIPNGIDVDGIENYRRGADRAEIRKGLGIGPEEQVITIVGTVCQRKGQKIFLEAAAKLCGRTDRPLRFLIVGARKSKYLEDMQQMIGDFGLRERVLVIDVCEDVYRYYMASDYFVCASYEESSPLVLLEAMAFRLPIVSTDVYGIPELVRNKNEALLVKPGKPDELAQALLTLLESPELAARMTQNAHYRLLEKYTRKTMLLNYDRLFQEACEEGGNRVYGTLVSPDKGV